MKPTDLEQLDELAAGLDAGWDTPEPAPTQVRLSQAPLSTPPGGEDLDALDADWDVPGTAKAPGRAQPLRVSKQARRANERKRLAHQAQQKSANKQQRKAERQEEARRANEQRRAEQQAQAARAASAQKKRAKTPKPSTQASAPSPPKREAKQTRRVQSASTAPSSVPAKIVPSRVVRESALKKLIPLVAIALVVGGTLCFALMRAAGH